MFRSFALLVIGACGSAPPPTEPVRNEVLPAVDPGGLEVRVSYLSAWEEGAQYRYTIHRDGGVDWKGIRDVKTMAPQHRQADRRQLDQLEPALELATFWERDAYGHLPGPEGPDCDDATQIVIEVHRGAMVHKVDFTDGCSPDPAMVHVVEILETVAGSSAWR